ncbi:MAG: polymer-forming cytoskeletal protein [Magnetococcales bacterium]|nr:polymer-forming cytoskeletal protein [Magnetococcales bacterium]
MAVFSKLSEPKVDKSGTTIIATGTQIEGEIRIECKLHVDGQFKGEVISTSLVTIGKSGAIKGDLVAKKMEVTGVFDGEAQCEDIEIHTGGKVSGHITSKVLVIERGSTFEGQSKLVEADADFLNKSLDKLEKSKKKFKDKKDKGLKKAAKKMVEIPISATAGAQSSAESAAKSAESSDGSKDANPSSGNGNQRNARGRSTNRNRNRITR